MTVEELNVKIKVDLDNFSKGVKQASNSLKSFGEKTQTAMKEAQSKVEALQKKFEPLTKVATAAFATITAAVGGTVAALVNCATSTEEYRQKISQLSTAFESAGSSADVAKETYNGLYRVLGDTDKTVEAASHLAKLTQNQNELSNWVKICTGVYATFGDSLPIEGLTEAANETAKTGTVTGVLADALNWAGISEDAFNEALAQCSTEQDRQKLILDTLLGQYTEAANLYEKNASATLTYNDAQRRLTDATAQIGKAMQPVLTSFEEFKATIAEKLAPVITDFIDSHLEQFQEVLGNLADKVSTVVEFIANNLETIGTIATIIAAVSGAILVLNVALSATSMIMGLLALNPVVLIITAIIAAVVALGILIATHWEEVKGFFNSIAEFFQGIDEKVEEFLNNFIENGKAKIEEIKQKFVEFKENIIETVTAIKEGIVEKFTSIKDAVTEKVDSLKQGIIDKFTSIKDGIKEKIEAARDVVQSAIEKIRSFFNFSWSLPHLSLPHISIVGNFSLNPLSVPHFSIAWYAKGGVFDTPTLFGYGGGIGGLGEAGAEAVVPLERNTEWLDKIADRLNRNDTSSSERLLREQNYLLQKILDKSGVYIDGKELSNTVTKYQRQQMRAMGG